MPTPVEIVKAFNEACQTKNETLLRDLMHPQYTAHCPLIGVISRDEALETMQGCPMKCHNENSVYVTEGNTVVRLFDWIVDAPFQGRSRTAQYFQLENEQVRSVEMFYDTAIFPAEFLEEMKQMMKEKAAV